jgi:hypothetical protein
MQIISFIDGKPEYQAEPGWIASWCDGENYYFYYEGDEVPPEHQPPNPEPVKLPHYSGLASALRNSAPWTHAFSVASTSAAIQAGFTLALTTLTNAELAEFNGQAIPPSWLDDLKAGWFAMVQAMAAEDKSFNSQQLLELKTVLTNNNFDPSEFGFT